MKMVREVEVKSAAKSKDNKREVVAKIDYPEYETLDEAVKALSEARALELCNVQVATNAKNEARAAATGVPSQSKLKEEAFMRLAQHPHKLQEVAGDAVRLNALLEAEILLIKKEKGIDQETLDTEAVSA